MYCNQHHLSRFLWNVMHVALHWPLMGPENPSLDNCTNVHYPSVMSKPNPPKTPGGARKRKPKRFAAVEAGADRDQAVLDMIAGSLREQGRPPTIREIGEAFGIASTNGVRYYLDRLEKAGKNPR